MEILTQTQHHMPTATLFGSNNNQDYSDINIREGISGMTNIHSPFEQILPKLTSMYRNIPHNEDVVIDPRWRAVFIGIDRSGSMWTFSQDQTRNSVLGFVDELLKKDEIVSLTAPRNAWKTKFSYPLVCVTNENIATKAFFYSVLERNLASKKN